MCWDRLPSCCIPQNKVKHTTLNQRAWKLLWVYWLLKMFREFICVDSCKNVSTFTCQVYLPHWELCWNLLISPLQSTLRFSDESQSRSPKDVEHTLPAESYVKSWRVLKGVLPINLHLNRRFCFSENQKVNMERFKTPWIKWCLSIWYLFSFANQSIKTWKCGLYDSQEKCTWNM